MEEASSAYDRAENVQATAASTKDRMTAGPATFAPSPITTKMPVPMIAPTPMAVSCVAPTDFLSPWPSSVVSVTRDPTSLIANIPGFRPDVVAMLGPPSTQAAAAPCPPRWLPSRPRPGAAETRAGASPSADLTVSVFAGQPQDDLRD